MTIIAKYDSEYKKIQFYNIEQKYKNYYIIKKQGGKFYYLFNREDYTVTKIGESLDGFDIKSVKLRNPLINNYKDRSNLFFEVSSRLITNNFNKRLLEIYIAVNELNKDRHRILETIRNIIKSKGFMEKAFYKVRLWFSSLKFKIQTIQLREMKILW